MEILEIKLKAIETIYNSYRFRSRLEARWAVFFDAAKIRYEYEIEGSNLDKVFYLPDFWLPEKGCWIEIKGVDEPPYIAETQEISQTINKCMLLAQQSKKPVLCLYGQIPNLSLNLKRYGFPVEKDIFYCLGIQGVAWYEVTPQFDFYGNLATEYPLDGLEFCWPHSKYSWLYDEPSLLKARQARFKHSGTMHS